MTPGLFLLLASGCTAALHIWVSRGVFLTLPSGTDVDLEYVFISDSFATLLAIAAGSCAVLFALHSWIRSSDSRAEQPPLFSRQDTRYALPLLIFGVSVLPLLALVPGIGRPLSVVSYVLVDLRWWWAALIVAWVAVRIDDRLQHSLSGHASKVLNLLRERRWLSDLAIVGLAMTWVVAGTPGMRFSSQTSGDEPKYLRHAELLYQGAAFELSQLKLPAELPADVRPQVHKNVVRMFAALPDDLRSLVRDAGIFIRDPSHRFNRAQKSGGFLVGKNGGDYQVHTPGISFLMLPAYVLDRQFGGPSRDPDTQWPQQLIGVNAFFLCLYAVWMLLTFRLLRQIVSTTWIPWVTTIALMFTMPVATFPFQFYPEMAAGAILMGVAGYVLSPTAGLAASAFAGLAAGYLPWLHVRFSALTMVLILAGIFVAKKTPARRAVFVAGAVVSLGSMSLYAYHLTGSILPWSMWQEASGRDVVTLQAAIRGGIAYLVDNRWGLFAHAPVYLMALPGYWWMARKRPQLAWLCGIAFLSLVLPAAAHTLHAAGGTPMRLIVAVVPFAGLPLAHLLENRGRSPVVQIAFGLTLLLSLHTALAYNFHQHENTGALLDRSFSGWKIHMLFPDESRSPWDVSTLNGLLFCAWIGATAGLLIWPVISDRMRRRTATEPVPRTHSVPTLAMASAVVFVLLASAVSAATGTWQNERFRRSPRFAARPATAVLQRIDRCALCISSLKGAVDTDSIKRTLSAFAPDDVAARPTARDYQAWLTMPAQIRAWYRDANGHEPAGADIGHYLYQWREENVPDAEIRRRIVSAAKPKPDE